MGKLNFSDPETPTQSQLYQNNLSIRTNQTGQKNTNDEACLGFAPRSQSFALKPNGLVGSICSLSGLTHYRSYRPSANPPNSQFALLATIIPPLKKATQGGFF